MAIGDVNRDGIDDVFVSGAAGQSGQWMLSSTSGTWSVEELNDSREVEQLGSLLFDWDGDGDRDLYVVSGGVEAPADSELLQDRLYINDGEGHFSVAKDVVPQFRESGSCVAGADYDRDGDIDLFVGGRVVPGEFPMSPPSRLLRNDGGRFSHTGDAVLGVEDPLHRVTDAIWSDVDIDGWIDLLVAQHWGPIRYFRNDHGRLVEATTESGLADFTGWWNGVTGGDFDNDGDIDFVATNQGLNSKYHATPDRPTLLYYGDFEGNGQKQIVEATFEDDVLYPDRGRSCTTSAMPSLGGKFDSFKSFATATLDEVYASSRLEQAVRLEANTLESGVFMNNGAGRFSFKPLPRLAQAAPGFGVVTLDVDGDGNLDIYMVQNSFSPQPETGHFDGSMSLLLRGSGNGEFNPVWPSESGLIVPGDAKPVGVVDLNSDGRPDVIVGVNGGNVLYFVNRKSG
jgi:hypothetical protein